MSFGLKNIGVTYQRLVIRMFETHIGRNMKVYVDNMMVKTKSIKEHFFNLEEIFSIIIHYKTCLNTKKCAFGVLSRKLLGYQVSS